MCFWLDSWNDVSWVSCGTFSTRLAKHTLRKDVDLGKFRSYVLLYISFVCLHV